MEIGTDKGEVRTREKRKVGMCIVTHISCGCGKWRERGYYRLEKSNCPRASIGVIYNLANIFNCMLITYK